MKLVVLGAGWLGSAIIERAIQANWQVQGTSRSLNSSSAIIRQFTLQEDKLIHSVDLTDAYWVCAIPPRARHADSNYLETLSAALRLSDDLACKGFLLCSSTGVYSEQDGTYTESGELDSGTTRKKILLAAEQRVFDSKGKVLRLAGLVGPNREPGKFVAGKTLKSSSQAAVNMVHQADVVAAIETIILNWAEANAVYNVCHPDHPTRQDYYLKRCAKLGTQPPLFSSDIASARVIDGSAIEALGFSYQAEI
ncbi:NADP-binding protein [Pseudoalteromonas phenolica]|uniref:NADP-binding protein n=2 Tax=Pseudoalteromonas phenolica TaxID=161398 RepID=A0A5R9Q688_9GAMM|nr:NADP-binding protein [Pseudoalteromonas phenolica]TLX48651.1 NADP-binding protein [Pseudoalteromonas phenolica]